MRHFLNFIIGSNNFLTDDFSVVGTMGSLSEPHASATAKFLAPTSAVLLPPGTTVASPLAVNHTSAPLAVTHTTIVFHWDVSSFLTVELCLDGDSSKKQEGYNLNHGARICKKCFKDYLEKGLKNYKYTCMYADRSAQLENEPRREKTGLRGFRPGPTQTDLYQLRKELEA